jgi:hypothetical protein
MGLEKILGNFGKGLAIGATKVVDPIGTNLSYLDKWETGAGYSNERALETFHNHVYKLAYDNPEKEINLKKDYIPRGIGTGLGLGLGALGLYSLYCITPILGLAAPIVTGIYGLVNTIKKYTQGIIKGEKTENPSIKPEIVKEIIINKKGKRTKKLSKKIPYWNSFTLKEIITNKEGKRTEKFYERASFKNGFYYGWNKLTHLYVPLIHDVESYFTGRGLNNSKFESSIKHSSKPIRRNLKAILGSLAGSIVGAAVFAASFGIIPLYKSIRDTKINLKRD